MKKLIAQALSVFVVIVGTGGLTACDSGLSSIAASDLRKRVYDCEMSDDLTAPELQVCKNIQRECKRREKEGRYDC